MKVDLEYFKSNFFGYKKERFPISLWESRSVKSCIRCEGTGSTSHEELTNYHKREYDTIVENCNVCNGEGRIIQTIVNVSFGDIPYNPKLKTDCFRNILLEKTEEPYSKELHEKIKEAPSQVKTFIFDAQDIKER